MDWSKEDSEALISFTQNIDFDNIKVKEAIKKKILNNRFIIHAIHNVELEALDAEPDEYFGTNILPYLVFPDTQHNNKTYICFEVGYDDHINGWPHGGRNYPATDKILRITFYIQCDNKDSSWCIDSETGVARHDLIAALLQDEFNWINIGGGKLALTSDLPSTTDNFYSTRTLIFEQIADNNLARTKDGIPRLDNKSFKGMNNG